ncbi:DUF4350 domain-containing protein [Adhaeribacter pallidiroseus]|uniref:DUF4350 domain-containing protein n=1 Tax=Adhaeribacter pallidiroseus TaxID=2072847 RepID=A0A369QM18_9BACT|nr:DUF4350 domain-containing protein [Adhaeribacter pallidiroseus]RDC64266.1 hypothetical protein AHMF7616_02879 [Adhaeribacter pallidiroseus]
MRNYRISLALLGILFAALVTVEYYQPKPIDWRQTFVNQDKIPYGTYVLYQLLPNLFRNQEITTVRQPILNQLEEAPVRNTNYIFINNEFDLDSLDQQALLAHVARGNQVFIAAESFARKFTDTLGFTVRFTYKKPVKDRFEIYFINPNLGKQRYFLKKEKSEGYITLRKKAQATALGRNSAGLLNFIAIRFGKGVFYLNTVPAAFTNYYVLSPQHANYAATALSYLPTQPVFWDEYQKQGGMGEQSVFRVLLAHPPLRWAYYITLVALVLYVLFEGKRTQRVIPILEPPANETLAFVRVVGNLYFNNRNHKNIAEKKIRYFLEYLRLHFYETSPVNDPEAQERIAARSGVALIEVNELFYLLQKIHTVPIITDENLGQLNQQLEAFYHQTKQ